MTEIFQTIRPAIVAKVKAEADKVAFVYMSDRGKFEGFPAVIVSPSDSASDYADSSVDQMDVAFIVRAHYPIAEGGEDEADTVLAEVVDQLLTIFSIKTVLSSVCDWSLPVPSSWGYQPRESGPMRTAEIKVKCRKYVENI